MKTSGYESDDSRGSNSLETVLEVPDPEEFFLGDGEDRDSYTSWTCSMKQWMRSQIDKASTTLCASRRVDLQPLLGLLGAPLVPLPFTLQPVGSIKNNPTEASSAQYIVQQYIAACGGVETLNSINNLYAMGSVRVLASEFESSGKVVKAKNLSKVGDTGCFVLWQMSPEKWSMELMVAGVKLNCGSDGKQIWRQTPWLGSNACRGPCRPLRRSVQGLDPRTTANLFSNSRCIGEKTVGQDSCFMLKVGAESPTLTARSSSTEDIIRHHMVGYFSQKTGLLVKVEDNHLLRLQKTESEFVYWESKMETTIDDYRLVDGGVMVAHSGHTVLGLYKFGEAPTSHTRTKMEEWWRIKEAGFNVQGLDMDTFRPPADLHCQKPVTSEAFDLQYADFLKADSNDKDCCGGSRSLIRSNGRNYSKVVAIDRSMEGLSIKD